jgi:membrane-associated phospholipid phosphatase
VVTLSTLLTGQHFFADVLAGAVLAMLCWRLVARHPR